MSRWSKSNQIHSALVIVSMVGGLMSMAVFYDPNHSQTQHVITDVAPISASMSTVEKAEVSKESIIHDRGPHYRGVISLDARYERLDEQAAVQYKSISGHHCGLLPSDQFNSCRELVMTALEHKKNSIQVIDLVNKKFGIL